MSKARGKIRHLSASSDLTDWIKRNAHWFYPELDMLDRPDWVRIAAKIAEDGVVMRRGPDKGNPPTADAVRKAVAYWETRVDWRKGQAKPQPLPTLPASPSPPSAPSSVAPSATPAAPLSMVELQRRRLKGNGPQ